MPGAPPTILLGAETGGQGPGARDQAAAPAAAVMESPEKTNVCCGYCWKNALFLHINILKQPFCTWLIVLIPSCSHLEALLKVLGFQKHLSLHLRLVVL